MNRMTGNKSRSHRDRVMLNNIKLEEKKVNIALLFRNKKPKKFSRSILK